MHKRQKISVERKLLILSEVALPGSSISKIAKSYGISKTAIYKWIKLTQAPKINHKNISSSANNNFTEIALIESKTSNKPNLQKASLIFDDLSLSLEGSISMTRLLKLLKALEEIC